MAGRGGDPAQGGLTGHRVGVGAWPAAAECRSRGKRGVMGPTSMFRKRADKRHSQGAARRCNGGRFDRALSRQRQACSAAMRRTGSESSVASSVGTRLRPASEPRVQGQAPKWEGHGQRNPYLTLQPSQPLRSRLENAAAASRAARPRFLIGRGRSSQKPSRGAQPNKLYGDSRRRTRTRAGLGAGPPAELSRPPRPGPPPSPFSSG